MKSTKLIIFITILTIIFGCNSNTFDNKIVEPQTYNEDLLWKNLTNAGFELESIIDKGDYFIVEDDIIITKDELSKYNFDCNNLKKTNQHVVNGVIDLHKVGNIRVRIDESLHSTGWDTAIREAIQIWSGISNCRLNITEASTPIDINTVEKVMTYEILIAKKDSPLLDECMKSTLVAAAKFPSNGNPGNQISIGEPIWNSEKRRAIILHELGHTLGFRHTDWKTEDEGVNTGDNGCGVTYGSNYISSTPDNYVGTIDEGSIMQKYLIDDWNTTTLGFYDKIATRVMYPITLTAPISVQHIYENYEHDRDHTRIDLGVYTNYPYQYYELWYFDGSWIKSDSKFIVLQDFIYDLPLKIVLQNYGKEYTKTIYTNISEHL